MNHDLVLLYWDIGRDIVEKQTNAAWGDAAVPDIFSLPKRKTKKTDA